MAGPTHRSRPAQPTTLHCAICEGSFASQTQFDMHMVNHPDATKKDIRCAFCNWPFPDSHELEKHQIAAGHKAQYHCDACGEGFVKSFGLIKHRKFPSPCSDAFTRSPTAMKKRSKAPHPTDRKSGGQEGYLGGYFDPDTPRLQPETVGILRYDDSFAPTEFTNPDDIVCAACKRTFSNESRYDHHKLGCNSKSRRIDAASPLDNNALEQKRKPSLMALRSRPETAKPVGGGPFESSAAAARKKPDPAPALEAAKPAGGKFFGALHSRPSASALRKEPARAPAPTPAPEPSHRRAPTTSSLAVPTQSTPSNAPGTGTFICNVGGCGKSCRSEAGLKVHKQDAHNIGGRGLDLIGKDSWMLNPRERERLKSDGLLHAPGPSSSGRRGPPAPMSRPPPTGPAAMNRAPPRPAPVVRAPISIPPFTDMSRFAPPSDPAASMPAPAGPSVSGPAELEQAQRIYDQIMRLLIAADIVIQNDGKIVCDGNAWTRIGVARQPDVVGMLDKFVHLKVNTKLQGIMFLPSPKAFKIENELNYATKDFEQSPDRLHGQHAFGAVAIATSKIILADGCQDIVKIAAIDILSCRVVMDYLVCTDPTASVKDWRTKMTGLTSFRDMEAARQDGYRVLKGWKAARAALWKFIDRETIIVGHNLRNDMDALRMIHGRAIDVTKSIEKAADGPLSKAQLSLESISRDFPAVRIAPHPNYGQDVLQSAFAVREIALWMLKNETGLVKKAKAMSLDYQRLG
ncbi:hypothetical protein P280DRAFT_510380 [Massarina eburnea CBS 473.64]|uniref:C2H2-type domain-containing protein n=1 Tax=Massarina eburnea CBS 473.64 TaxID=1395130 RepID=A0A6A6RQU2_9PLEO|nr:hypothetical protein P280DRAFT_510380 [Massarina eburnea CBS 473.64]